MTMIHYSKIDLQSMTLRTESKELQMDGVLMRVEEVLEVKINQQELNIFKKDFENYYLVPLDQLEQRMNRYIGENRDKSKDFEISLVVLMNIVLEEWEKYQNTQRKKLLKKFIDFDENGDGVLTLDEFKELMKNIEGSQISQDRVIMLFNEALELSNREGDSTDKIEPNCFVETMMKNRVGGYGVEFLDFEFIQNDK